MERTSAYVKTVQVTDGKQLTDIKERVRLINAGLRHLAYTMDFPTEYAPRLKVVTRGRLGKNNPHAHLYRRKPSISSKHATRLDVYVDAEYFVQVPYPPSLRYGSPEYAAREVVVKKLQPVYEALRNRAHSLRDEYLK